MGVTGQVATKGKGGGKENQNKLCQLSSPHVALEGFELDIQSLWRALVGNIISYFSLFPIWKADLWKTSEKLKDKNVGNQRQQKQK